MDGLCVGEGFWMEGWFQHAIVRLGIMFEGGAVY